MTAACGGAATNARSAVSPSHTESVQNRLVARQRVADQAGTCAQLAPDSGVVKQEPGNAPTAVERQIRKQRKVIALWRGARMRLPREFSHLTGLLLTSNAHLVIARSGEF